MLLTGLLAPLKALNGRSFFHFALRVGDRADDFILFYKLISLSGSWCMQHWGTHAVKASALATYMQAVYASCCAFTSAYQSAMQLIIYKACPGPCHTGLSEAALHSHHDSAHCFCQHIMYMLKAQHSLSRVQASLTRCKSQPELCPLLLSEHCSLPLSCYYLPLLSTHHIPAPSLKQRTFSASVNDQMQTAVCICLV